MNIMNQEKCRKNNYKLPCTRWFTWWRFRNTISSRSIRRIWIRKNTAWASTSSKYTITKGKGGLSEPDKVAQAVYIDTEGTFRPERIIQIAKGSQIDPDSALRNILFIRAYNSDHQINIVKRLPSLIHEGRNIRLLVIDSITAHFRAEYVGRSNLAERQQRLNQHLRDLLKLATVYNIAVYVTNQVMAKPEGFFAIDQQAVGGHVLAHAITYRIFMRKGKDRTRIARLIDAPHLPEREAIFRITEEGIRDA